MYIIWIYMRERDELRNILALGFVLVSFLIAVAKRSAKNYIREETII